MTVIGKPNLKAATRNLKCIPIFPQMPKFSLESCAQLRNSQPLTVRLAHDFLWLPLAKVTFSGVGRRKKGAGSCEDPALVSDSDQLLGRYHGHGRIGRGCLCRRRGGLTFAGQAALPSVLRHVTHRGVEGTVFPFFNVAFDGVHHQLRGRHAGVIRQLALRAVIRGLILQGRQLTPRIQRRLHLGLELLQRHAGKRLRRAKRRPSINHRLQLSSHTFRIWFGHYISPPFCLYFFRRHHGDGKFIQPNPDRKRGKTNSAPFPSETKPTTY